MEKEESFSSQRTKSCPLQQMQLPAARGEENEGQQLSFHAASFSE